MKLHSLTEFASGHQFLEGLRWHDGTLWASDFFSKKVLTFAADGTATTVAEIPGSPSGLGFLADGSTLVVSQADATVTRIAPDGVLSTYADFSSIAGGPAGVPKWWAMNWPLSPTSWASGITGADPTVPRPEQV